MSYLLRLLGTRVLERDGRAVDSRILAQPKRLALLVYLSAARAEGREWVSRDELLALFWPESEAAKARKALSQTLWVIARELGDGIVAKRGRGDVGLEAGAIDLDLGRFDRLIEASRLEEALDLYHGDFLAGFHLSGAGSFHHWLDSVRTRTRGRAVDAAWSLARESADRGDVPAAARWTRWALRAGDSSDEGNLRKAMAFLNDLGDRAGALAVYQTHEESLAEEGDAPLPATAQLADEIRGPSRPLTRPRRRRAPRAAPQPTTPDRGRSSRWLAAGTALLVLLAGSVAGSRMVGPRSADGDTAVGRLLILPFEHRGDLASSYLRSAIVDLLALRLDGIAELRAVDPAAVFAATARSDLPADPEVLTGEFGAEFRLEGTVTGVGEGFELSAVLVSRDGAEVARASATAASDDEVLRAVDALALGLLGERLAGLGEPLASSAALDTRSVDALRAFLRGEAAFRRFDFPAAEELYDEAIRHDSTFALAYFRLSRAGDWSNRPQAMTRGLDGAARWRERLPPSSRRLLDGYLAFWRGSVETGLETLDQLAHDRPFDGETRFQLADAQFHGYPRLGRSILDSRPEFEAALRLNPNDRRAQLHLLGLTMYAGDTARANELAAELGPGDDVWEFRRMALARDLPPARPDAELIAALERVPIAVLPGAVLSAADFREDPELLELAGRRAFEGGATEAIRIEGLRLEMLGAAAAGRLGDARAVAEALSRIDPIQGLRAALYLHALPWAPVPSPGAIPNPGRDPEARVLAGLALLRAGDLPGARALAEEMPSPSTARERNHHALLGAALLAPSDPDAALRVLTDRRAQGNRLSDFSFGTLLPHMYERWVRAEILERLGRDEEALTWYGTVAAPVSHTLPFAAPAHLARARILRRLGRKDEAEGELRRAAAIWANCVPELRAELDALGRALRSP